MKPTRLDPNHFLWATRVCSLVFLAGLVILATHSVAGEVEADPFTLFQASLPQLRAVHPDSYDTPDKIQTAWLGFRKNLALAQTALKKGYADLPEIRTRMAQMLAQELILKEAETARPMHSISEHEIQDYFEAHMEQYDLPATLGAHEIVLRYDPADPRQREQQMAKAKDVLTQLGSGPVEVRAFQELTKANSDPQSFRTNGGSLGLFPARSHHGQKPPVPEAAVTALLALKQVGRVTEILDDGNTLRILRLSAYREAVPPKLETFKDSIRRQLYLKAREDRIETLARESGWNPTGKLTADQIENLLRPAHASGSSPDVPPVPGGLGIPEPK
jgi:hypothetical protein